MQSPCVITDTVDYHIAKTITNLTINKGLCF
jgi:hypothetical protein